MAGVAGQNKLAGIFRYLSERYPDDSPWDITLVRTRAELTRELVEKAVSGGTDGFIVSIPETEESVVPLADVSTPTIVMDIRSAPLERRKKNLVTIRNSGEVIQKDAQGQRHLVRRAFQSVRGAEAQATRRRFRGIRRPGE